MGLGFFFNPTLIWFFIGLVLLIAEFSVPGVILVFFGIGAWVTAVLSYFFHLSLLLQLLIFLVTSVAGLLSMRTRLVGEKGYEPDVTDDFLGKTAVVKEPLTRGSPGRVTFKGAAWKAETQADETLMPGRYVRIIGKESIVLHVEPIQD
ncbi:MAG: NfeD family protein [Thermodesulfobacteriota bacterium]